MPKSVKIGGKKYELIYGAHLEIEKVNIKDFTKLIKFSNEITGVTAKKSTIESLDGLEKLSNLTKFGARICSIKNISALSSCSKLKFVYLDDLGFDGKKFSDMNDLGDLPNLTNLTLRFNNVSKISNLERRKFLKFLAVGGNQLSKIEGLENCKNLKILTLSANQINKI